MDVVVPLSRKLLMKYIYFPWEDDIKPYSEYSTEEYSIFDGFFKEIVRCAREMLNECKVADKTHAAAAVALTIKTILQVDYYIEGPILRDALEYVPGATTKDLCQAEFHLFRSSGFLPCNSSPFVRIDS